MKNFLLSLTLIFSISFLNAQTITSDWFYDIGDQETQNYVIDASTLTTPVEQLNGTWDFSNVTNDSIININYIDPNTVSQFSDFPYATIVRQYNNESKYVFFEEDATSIKIIGEYYFEDNNGNPNEIFIDYEEFDVIAMSPWSIGEFISTSVVNNYIENGVQTNFDFVFKSAEIVGNGTVTTPSGTFNNCLMIKVITEPGAGRTSFPDPIISIEYIFVKDRLNNQIAKYVETYNNYDFNDIDEVSFYYNDANPTINIEEVYNLDIEILSSNSESIQVKSGKAFEANIQFIDINGKLMQSQNINLNKGLNTFNTKYKSAKHPTFLIITNKSNGYFKVEQLMY